MKKAKLVSQGPDGQVKRSLILMGAPIAALLLLELFAFILTLLPTHLYSDSPIAYVIGIVSMIIFPLSYMALVAGPFIFIAGLILFIYSLIKERRSRD
jgi:hypothetical protein